MATVEIIDGCIHTPSYVEYNDNMKEHRVKANAHSFDTYFYTVSKYLISLVESFFHRDFFSDLDSTVGAFNVRLETLCRSLITALIVTHITKIAQTVQHRSKHAVLKTVSKIRS